ncbi:MAG: FecR domain-containing protein [Verrucomicrobiaceae bacterium]|nr:FecR domain-containing protein [Verrucomicrobiaceae bacterium]
MPTTPNSERIQRALDGLLSPEEMRVFQVDVTKDAVLREAYVEQLWLHAQLKAKRDDLKALLEEKIISQVQVPRWRFLAPALAAAACVVLGLGAWFGLQKGNNVAVIAQAENCKWAGSELPTVENAPLGAGRLSLVEGIATLRFRSGASVTMEAPTTLEILDAMHCRLIEGTVTADVPVPAHGFTIDTPDIQVVDLGTKFGVTAASTGNSQVRVFEGEVKIGGLEDLDRGEFKHLTTGKGLNVGGNLPQPGQETARDMLTREDGGWTAITTQFGRGKDAYVRRMDDKLTHGSDPLLIVKHTDLELGRKNERRAILTFDLSQIDLANVKEAQLMLDPEPSGFGFSSLVPDSRFAVLGLHEGDTDAWSEADLLWQNLPGTDDAGPLPQRTRRLAEFWLPRGGSGDVITIRADALAEFIRSARDGLITLLLLRETGESDTSGLAHGFAAKEHPTARAPTLRLRMR